jgi:hypothetical protein
LAEQTRFRRQDVFWRNKADLNRTDGASQRLDDSAAAPQTLCPVQQCH